MLGGADNPNGELLSYIIGADSQGGAGCCLHPLADKSALPVPPPA